MVSIFWLRYLFIIESDIYIITGKFKDQWARIGNSVPPYLMKAIAETIYNEILSKIP